MREESAWEGAGHHRPNGLLLWPLPAMASSINVGDFAVDAAQALLTGFDTALSKQWREEDRKWREEDRGWRASDMQWRDTERKFLAMDKQFMNDNYQWREEDVEQRHVENARYLWMRFVEKNRREIEEKSEQLRVRRCWRCRFCNQVFRTPSPAPAESRKRRVG